MTDGRRVDAEAAFVSRRAVDVEAQPVHRLAVEDRTGATFAVLVVPGNDPVHDARTGETYRFENLLAVDPVDPSAPREDDCPACGGALRLGTVVDALGGAVARATAALGLTETLGVVDAATTVRRRGGRTTGDATTEAGVPSPPDCVCAACGCHVAAERCACSR